ncbi:MAG: Ca-activated chloride channel family protein [Mariniblastus sp.]
MNAALFTVCGLAKSQQHTQHTIQMASRHSNPRLKMNNKSKQDLIDQQELAAASAELASLEAASVESADNVDWHQLGQLVRESAELDLPPADPELRATLIVKLEELASSEHASSESNESGKTVSLSGKANGQSNGGRHDRWVLTVVALLTALVGGSIWYAAQTGDYHSNKDIALVPRKNSGAVNILVDKTSSLTTEDEKSLVAEKTARAMQFAQLERVQATPEQRQRELPQQEVESLEQVSELSSRLSQSTRQLPGEGIPVKPPLLPQTSVNNMVSVPDGGTFFFGGIKQVSGQPEQPPLVVTPKDYSRGAGFSPSEVPFRVIDLSKNSSKGLNPTDDAGREFASGGLGIDVNGKERIDRRIRFEDLASSIEQYDAIVENSFLVPQGELAFSTFSIDVDTASYSNMRRFITAGQRPPASSVRIEELVNYFTYDYAEPTDGKPFAVQMEMAACPWQPEHHLVRIGIKGKDIHRDDRPVSNLVFLLDVSGSMQSPDKLALLQRGLLMMIDRLNENDKVSIVTYAGNAGVRLEPTSGDQKLKIRTVIEQLAAGGSTNGSAGIEKAYALATENFIKGGTNRVILATDGDLNVGVTDDQSLVKLISEKASEDVFLTVLGFGTGNLKDSKMEKLADNGNGLYAYIDSIREARKVLVDQMSSSLVTIAKDVKLQIDFNPTEVKAYRLLGYENRALANEDFANDQKDAGDMGAGHTVTALYEIVPTGLKQPATLSSQSKYQMVEVTPQEIHESPTQPSQIKKAKAQLDKLLKDYQETIEKLGAEHSSAKALNGQIIELKAKLAVKNMYPGEILSVAIRFKEPVANTSTRHDFVLNKTVQPFYEASRDFRFAAAVASFGMQLRHSNYRGQHGLNDIEKIASEAMGDDQAGYRAEFVDLVRQYANLIMQ